MKYTDKPNQNVGFVSEEELREKMQRGYMMFGTDFHRTNLTAYKYILKILGMKNEKE